MLAKNNKTLGGVNFEDIFINNDILHARKRVIERKVKEIIQSNTITQILARFKEIFGITPDIAPDDLRNLITIANNRHLLLHNDGIVTNIYIQNLKANSIESQYKVGDCIRLTEKDVRIANTLIERVGRNIYDRLVRQIEQVMYYAKEKYGK